MSRVCFVLAVMAGCGWAAEPSKSVWDGVFTAAQATRGEAAYGAECARCHREDFGGYGNVLTGGKFMERWREDTVHNFFSIVKSTMPRNAPASLPDATYADIVAYVLQANGFPAGKAELRAGEIANVRIQAREGPAPVPDFALVEVAGCLTQRADGEWLVLRATEPVRTRNPTASPADELKAWDTRPEGTHTFRLLDATYVEAHPPKGRKVIAKGLLIRQAGDDRLNTTDLQATGSGCEGR